MMLTQRSEDYSKLSKSTLNLSPEILSVDIVDYNGDFLARSVKPNIKDTLGIDTNLAKRWAMWTVLLVGLAKQFDDVLTETQFIVIGRKNFKRLLIPLPSHDIVLGLVLSRSAEASEFNDKIRMFLKSGSQNG
ncbi:MAG: hypothetical protein ACRECH_10320 [Nitrososphaerales archaeon]